MTIVTRSRNRVPRSAPVEHAPLLPATPVEREAALTDAVFAAILALQQQLNHPDAAVVREAAAMILDFEKTRIRHDRPVTGTLPDGGRLSPRVGLEHPLSERAGHPCAACFTRGEDAEVSEDKLDPRYVERVRRDLEGMKGRNGIPDVITRTFAEQVARHTLDPALRLRRNDECSTNDQ